MTRLLLRFDMRHPDFVVAPRSAHYSAALEMTRWADTHGFTAVALSEHHGVADGYLPSPLASLGEGAVHGQTKLGFRLR